MPPAYRFLERWVVPAPIERWWTDFVIRATGDEAPPEVGKGEWTLEETDGVTTATLDWRPSVNHALIRRPTPVLRPLFRSNHNWSMRHGERQIREYLDTPTS